MFAVSDVDLQVDEREIHCLIGPNGAGKSTLFKLITGTYAATAGRVVFRGADVTHLPSFARVQQGMSIKMQAPSVFNALSVRQNLHIALQRHVSAAEMRQEEDRLIALLDLADDAMKPAGQLAHGQRQWLEIGMALAMRPVLLLLDEPTAGLVGRGDLPDRRAGQAISGTSGITMLVVEHDMAFVKQIATRVTVLHLGKIFAGGNVDEIMADPRVGEIYLGTPHVEGA